MALLVKSEQIDNNPPDPDITGEHQVVQSAPTRFTYHSGSTPLAGYTIKRGIGIGGFGEVYFALSDAGKEVAIKRIQRNLDVELRGVSQCLNLKHVNLIGLWDIRRDENGQGWVVMEYVPGDSLRELINSFPNGMPIVDVMKNFGEIAAGVAYLHDHGIVHRDLKPGNIFCDADDQRIKIGDYGLSKFMSCSRRSGQTESVGTFHYMAPEIGKGVYGKEIDIYALGIVFYELLTGQVPFEGESSQEIIMKHLTAEPPLDAVPSHFQGVVRIAMAKDPDHRYSSVHEMLEDVVKAHGGEPILDDRSLTHPPQPLSPFPVSKGEAPTTAGGDTKKEIPPIQTMLTRSTEDPMYIGDDAEGIEMGELKEVVSSYSYDVEAAAVSPTDNSPHAANAYENARTKTQGVQSSHLQNSTIAKIANEEPIALAVRVGGGNVLDWWNNAKLSTPVKVIMLIAVGLALLSNYQWLVPVCLALAIAYGIYFSCRALYLSRVQKKALAANPVKVEILQQTKKEKASQINGYLRDSLRDKPLAEKLTELIGSFIFSMVVCGIVGLLSLAITKEGFKSNVETLSFTTWMTLSAVVGSWTILLVSKFWEAHRGDQLQRRISTLAAGIAVGLIVYALGAGMEVSPPENNFAKYSLDLGFVNSAKASGVTSYLLFFAGMFGCIRWWKQADPLRKTRLSFLAIGFCLIGAFVFNHFWQFPLPWGVMLAGTISVAVQVSSPWLHPENRTQICKRRQQTA